MSETEFEKYCGWHFNGEAMSILRSRNNQIFPTNCQVLLVSNQVFPDKNKFPGSHRDLMCDGFPRNTWGVR
jgi:hypothetical protein